MPLLCEHIFSAASRLCVNCGSPVPATPDDAHVHLWDFDSNTCVLCGRHGLSTEPFEDESCEGRRLMAAISDRRD